MATPAQLRANAQRSTGPRTPAGRKRSVQNRRTHGLTARRNRTCVDVVLQSEDPMAFEQLHATRIALACDWLYTERAPLDALQYADTHLGRAYIRTGGYEHEPTTQSTQSFCVFAALRLGEKPAPPGSPRKGPGESTRTNPILVENSVLPHSSMPPAPDGQLPLTVAATLVSKGG